MAEPSIPVTPESLEALAVWEEKAKCPFNYVAQETVAELRELMGLAAPEVGRAYGIFQMNTKHAVFEVKASAGDPVANARQAAAYMQAMSVVAWDDREELG